MLFIYNLFIYDLQLKSEIIEFKEVREVKEVTLESSSNFHILKFSN